MGQLSQTHEHAMTYMGFQRANGKCSTQTLGPVAGGGQVVQTIKYEEIVQYMYADCNKK